VPHFNLAPLENAIDRLKKSAKTYDTATYRKRSEPIGQDQVPLFELTRQTEESLAPDVGLPGRTWYKNLIYAPGGLPDMIPRRCRASAKRLRRNAGMTLIIIAVLTRLGFGSYANKLDEGARLMTPIGSSPQANR